MEIVALLAEGVDRNKNDNGLWFIERVALLAEGVDRNRAFVFAVNAAATSPSSRRAWIEIPRREYHTGLRSGRPPRGGRG